MEPANMNVLHETVHDISGKLCQNDLPMLSLDSDYVYRSDIHRLTEFQQCQFSKPDMDLLTK